jgi:hypothetical protein
LRVLCDGDSAAIASPVAPFVGTSGRRLALAQWLTARDSGAGALAARAMVNRVWQHLFGKGLVSTTENFGFGGAAPSHPELLEWLAAEFVDRGWSLKQMIRVIVSSSVYRQSADAVPVAELARVRESSNADADEHAKARTDDADRNSGEFRYAQQARAMQVDPDNRLLWRMRLKRLESEIIRDCVLATSGCLEATAGGPPVMLEWRPDGMVVVAEKQLPAPSAKWRRSVYLLARRAFQLSELTVFDQPVVATNCPERSCSAVPLQALTMMNGEWLWDQADRFAQRLTAQTPSLPDERVTKAFLVTFGRAPTADERRASTEFLDQQQSAYRQDEKYRETAERRALAHFCHTLLNTSEFLYVP